MAGAVELATAYLALVPSLKGASESISKQLTPASATAGAEGGNSLGQALMGGIKKFALPIAGIVAGLSVGKLVKDSVKDFQDYQGAVNGFGRIAGGSIQQFSGLRGAIQLSGVDVASATGGLTIFSKNLGNAAADGTKAADMAKKLGTSFLDAQGQVKPMSEIMPGLADKFKSMPDGAEKTALAMQLFGRSGAQMLPFLNQGSEGIAKLTGQAGKMGLVLDDTDKKIFAASKSSLREYNTSIQGMHIALGSTALPILTAFSNVGRSVMIPVIQAMTQALSAARGPVLALAGHVQAFADRVRGAMTGIITLFTTGNFTGGLGKALGIEEDSKIVSVIIAIRDGFVGAFGVIKSAVSGIDLGAIFATLRPMLDPVMALFAQLGPMFAPLIPQIVQLATSFSPLHLIIGALAPVLPQIGAAIGQLAASLGGALASALTTVVPVLVELASTIVGSLGQAVQAVLPAIVSLVPLVAQAFTQLLPVIAGLITQVVPLVASLLPPLIGLFTSLIPVVVQLVSTVLPVAVQIITMVVQAIVPLVTILAAMLIPIIQALMPVVTTVFGVIAQIITAVMQIVMGIIQVVLGVISGNWDMVWQGILNIFGGIWNTIVAVVSGILAILGSIIFGALNGVWSFIGDILGNIGRFFSDTWNNIVNGVVGAITWYINAVTNGFNIVWNFIQDVLGNIGRFFSDTWNNIVDGVSGMIGKVGGFFSGLWDTITGALSGAATWLFDAGKNIVTGLFDGIKSLASTIGNFFLGLLPGWIVEPFKIALGIQSPSRVFRQFGKHIGEGLILGAEDTKTDIESTIKGLVTVPDVPSFGASGSTAPGGRSSSVVNNITINQVDDPIGTSHALQRRMQALST